MKTLFNKVLALTFLLLMLCCHAISALQLKTECGDSRVSASYTYEMDTLKKFARITYRDATIIQLFHATNLTESKPGYFAGTAVFHNSPSGHDRPGNSFNFSYDKKTNIYQELGQSMPCK